MKAWLLKKAGCALEIHEIAIPQPKEEEILIEVDTCGICRTDLHILDGELNNPKLPLIMGHQIVGIVVDRGKNVSHLKVGDRVGVPWLARSCGKCPYCVDGQENLCDNALYTGYTVDGGFSEYCVANAHFAFPLPSTYSNSDVAPLLCAGMIGYRSLRLTLGAKKIGFYGFGVAAHILIQVINYQNGKVYAFTRKGNKASQEFALSMGACFAADSDVLPPIKLDAAIIFAPVGALYPQALKAVKKGGIVVSADIHMSDIPQFPYSLLWEERVMRSVSNLTRRDGEEFLSLASTIPIKTKTTLYPFKDLEKALTDQREGKIEGAKVLQIKN